MVKKTDITSAERAEFRQAMVHIHPIPDKIEYTRSLHQEAPKPLSLPSLSNIPAKAKISVYCSPQIIDADGYFYNQGLQKSLLRQLRNGQFPIDATVDLHGYRIDDAEMHMEAFLESAKHYQWRLIHIIHGKGLRSENKIGKIKQWLFTWLRERPDILAWQAASSREGGSGAGYCLLKTMR